MQWYVVIKTINGRRYLYRQKTYRVGARVKTINQYIGPYDGRPVGGSSAPADLTGATTLQLPFYAVTKSKVDADAVLADLVDPAKAQKGWKTPWGSRLRKQSLVREVPEAESLFAVLGVTWTQDGHGAFYSPGRDIVNIPDKRFFTNRDNEDATEGYYSTVFHEIVHWTKGPKRTGRQTEDSRDGYAREELVAELGSMILMRHFGLTNGVGAPHAKYFQTWLGRTNDKDASLLRATIEAERAVEFILKHGIMSK